MPTENTPSDAHARFESLLKESVERRTRQWGPPGAAPRRLGIVGAGLMGTSIAAAAVDADIEVVLLDSGVRARHAAGGRISDELVVGYGWSSGDGADAAAKVCLSDAFESLAGCDVVLESIFESAEAKRGLFKAIAPHLDSGAILATNTSTIPLSTMVEAAVDPACFCGIHFCHPVAKRRFVEIIACDTTSKETVAVALGLAERLGRFGIVVGDGAGFIVNRMLAPYLTAAFELLLDGVPPARIDAVALGHGMDQGPLELADEIGIDVLLSGALILRDAFPERFGGSMVPVALVKAKRLGVKSGAGVYRYDSDGKRHVDESLESILDRYRRPACSESPSDDEIGRALFQQLAAEAATIVEDGVAAWSGDISVACMLGLGFPEGEAAMNCLLGEEPDEE